MLEAEKMNWLTDIFKPNEQYVSIRQCPDCGERFYILIDSKITNEVYAEASEWMLEWCIHKTQHTIDKIRKNMKEAGFNDFDELEGSGSESDTQDYGG